MKVGAGKVHSTYMPSTRLSPALARLRFAARMAAGRARGRPLILSHLVTQRCNARCATCLWRDGGRRELDGETVRWLYGQAGAIGFAQLVVWGGEPLLREDLPELLETAKDAGLLTTVITNGWLAAERWPDLRGKVDSLILSVDDIGAAHDELRGLPGLFERLEAFVNGLQGDPLRPALLVNTVLSRLNRGALRRVAPLAKSWRAGLYFCPMETGQMQRDGFDGTKSELALPAGELRAAAGLARELKRAGYPVLATDEYLDLLARDPSVTAYTCRGPRAVLTVAADGAVRDCLRSDRPLANVADLHDDGRPLASVLDLPRRRELLNEASACTKCNNADVVELSWLWDLRPAMLLKAAQLTAF
jgi:MoaA/NifB/PqqE/SkfB family radical SAM enzyme